MNADGPHCANSVSRPNPIQRSKLWIRLPHPQTQLYRNQAYRPTVTMVVMELVFAGLVTTIIVMLAAHALG
jgi:hypothetical protein